MNLTEDDDGRTVTVAPGAVLTVALAEARTAGFRWVLEDEDDGAGPVTLASDALAPAAQPGGRALHEFRFVADRPGTATLRLVHRRPWSAGDPDERRWSVRVVVVGAAPQHEGS